MVIIILPIAIVVMAIFAIVGYIRQKNHNEIEDSTIVPCVPEFSVSDYLERIEKAGIEIAREQEKQEPYQLVLWLVVEGLRLNEDGTTEWIRREEDKHKPISVSYSPPQYIVQNAFQNIMQSQYNGCQNTARTNEMIQGLQSQIQACCINQQIHQQTAQLINAIQPAPVPAYFSSQIYNSPIGNCYYQQ